MEALALYVKAIGFGLAVAAPIGPMAVLCMRRTLIQGWLNGLATGIGIAVGNGLYALVAALGLAGVSIFVQAHESLLHMAAGLFLLYLGLKSLFAQVEPDDAPRNDVFGSWKSAFGSSVLLTLTNPPTIVMFAAIFAALAPKSGLNLPNALLTVAGVFTGSLAWWCALTAVVGAFRNSFGARARRCIDRIVGAALSIFGLFEIRRAI